MPVSDEFGIKRQNVLTGINALKNNKAIRIMDVETKFIKSKNILSPVLSDLFNVCIAQGVFPDCLKMAEVIPIFKKGDHNLATNYRPISILSQNLHQNLLLP